MSLSTRVIAALGAVVVIGAGTLGGSIAYAASQPAPVKSKATVTIGRSSTALSPNPTCYNGGKPLDTAGRQACAQLSNQPAGTFPKLSIKSSDQIGVGLDPNSAKNGWRAVTNGGNSQSGAVVSNFQKDNTFSGLQSAANVLTTNRDTALTIIEFDPNSPAGSASQGIIAVWFVDLVNSAAPVASPQDASQGQDPSQGQ
ncbi:hypothetical protein OG455_17680 [Kitasatospora sp. NBC_01287]|uniref:hypothetical protein n=1 Tax=Kitasatospora sp. NBC_01287 TaxID=2903573 RepID=UPI00225412DE|nr:hypothetical protein [Kitasatospora sp. NBC_01287]MCX4747330.1 hypothetical protein [Kitasatospora sp. NBC_01287]